MPLKADSVHLEFAKLKFKKKKKKSDDLMIPECPFWVFLASIEDAFGCTTKMIAAVLTSRDLKAY